MKRPKNKYVGKGGIKCYCCRMHTTLSETKKLVNRIERRRAKQNLNKNMAEE